MSPLCPGPRLVAAGFLVGAMCLATSVRAQLVADATSTLGMPGDPIARSARAVGMGRLTLVLPDANNRITLWDFAGNPTGILDADSVSTLEIRPAAAMNSSVHDANDATGGFERQDFAGSRQRVAVEGWRRSGGTTVFGVFGEVSMSRTDRPYDLVEERRLMLSQPTGSMILNGKMPWIATERMRYALHATLASESADEEFRLIRRNAAGEYVNQTGALVDPPNRYDPDESHVRSSGAGGGLSYRFGSWLTLAGGADFRMDKIRSRNQGDRYLSEYEEDRPYGIGQVSLAGRIQPGLEYGADARRWQGTSNATYVFTGSAGIGAIPIVGRGDVYDREEAGTLVRGRARWVSGPFELGASVRHGVSKVEITPPPAGDGSSLNAYLNSLFYDPRADSIALRDSVSHEVRDVRSVEFAGGVAWRLAGGGAIGVETHVWNEEIEQIASGEGPNGKGWDVRGGLEWPFAPVLAGRAGYIYRSEDADDLTDQNEFVSHAVTVGAGYQPLLGRWRFESGYQFEWGQADFGTPAQPRFTRQQIATQIKWTF